VPVYHVTGNKTRLARINRAGPGVFTVEEYASYKEACEARGLLSDDTEWERAMEDACVTTVKAASIRELFACIVVFNEPSNAMALFDKFVGQMGDDYRHKYSLNTGAQKEPEVRALVLCDIEDRVLRLGQSIEKVNMCISATDHAVAARFRGASIRREPRVIRDELDYDRRKMNEEANERFANAIPSQRLVMDAIKEALSTEHGGRFFVDAPGGTGKTYCFNGLLSHVRGEGEIAIAVASSGIAALLLYKGRTCHSRLKCAINPTAGYVLNVNVQENSTDATAKLLRRAKIIVWDEACMMHRHHLEVRVTRRNIIDRDIAPYETNQCGSKTPMYATTRHDTQYLK
jgi:hypothetical protein